MEAAHPQRGTASSLPARLRTLTKKHARTTLSVRTHGVGMHRASHDFAATTASPASPVSASAVLLGGSAPVDRIGTLGPEPNSAHQLGRLSCEAPPATDGDNKDSESLATFVSDLQRQLRDAQVAQAMQQFAFAEAEASMQNELVALRRTAPPLPSWVCSVCTFSNTLEPACVMCGMCGAARGRTERPGTTTLLSSYSPAAPTPALEAAIPRSPERQRGSAATSDSLAAVETEAAQPSAAAGGGQCVVCYGAPDTVLLPCAHQVGRRRTVYLCALCVGARGAKKRLGCSWV